MTPAAWGAFLGLVLGAGVLLALAGMPFRRRPLLDQRIAPYVRDTPLPSRLLVPKGPPQGTYRRALLLAATKLDSALGGSVSIRRRQERAGRPVDVESFRVQQVVFAATGAVAAAVLAPVLWLTRGMTALSAVVFVVFAAIAGAALADHLLSRAVQRRETELLAEFPAIAELLALAVTAGEGIVPALQRVAERSHGALSSEIRIALAESRTGAGIVPALQEMSRRTGVPALARFVDGLVIAVERGTPLGDVLRAQAADAQDATRQAVIESGGRREIAMMVPVVFLVLPVTILFAVYPGIAMLRLTL